jgi:hypothetical protein
MAYRQASWILMLGLLVVSCRAQAQTVEIYLDMSSCSGFLGKLTNNSNVAYVFAAGHCIPEIYDSEKPSKVLLNSKFEKPKKVIVRPIGQDASDAKTVSTTGVLFASLQGIDLAILPIKESVADLNRMNLSPLSVQLAIAALQTPVFIVNAITGEKAECSIENKPFSVSYKAWTSKWAYGLSPECKLGPGWSGAPIINQTNGSVVGVVSGGNDSGTCDDYCESDQSGQQTAIKNRAYFSVLSSLKACTAEDGTIHPENCLSLWRPEKNPPQDHL